MTTLAIPSKKTLWTGRIISILVILFMLLDAVMKVAKSAPSMKGSIELGWPEDLVPLIGIFLLICTTLYAIPRTAFIGAILLTGYLGGAISIMMRANTPYFFPFFMGILAWTGLFLKDQRLRELLRG